MKYQQEIPCCYDGKGQSRETAPPYDYVKDLAEKKEAKTKLNRIF